MMQQLPNDTEVGCGVQLRAYTVQYFAGQKHAACPVGRPAAGTATSSGVLPYHVTVAALQGAHCCSFGDNFARNTFQI
jgi:hypothetical protein